MTYAADERVDAYIDALPDWQQAICRQVRDLVHAADPEVSETIKRSRQPYFVLQGNICALLAARDPVNVFVYDGGIVPDPDGIITAGHDNKTAGHDNKTAGHDNKTAGHDNKTAGHDNKTARTVIHGFSRCHWLPVWLPGDAQAPRHLP